MIGFLLFENIHNKKDIASSRIRGRWLIKYWPEAEEYVYGKKYDVVIYQKAYLTDHARNFDGIKILDLCDPDWVDVSNFREMIDLVDAITVCTPAFKEFLQQITNKPIVVIPDRMDIEHYKEKKIHRNIAREVVWHGYAHNSYVLKQVVNTLNKYNLGISIISNEPVTLGSFGISLDGKKVQERYTKWDLETFNSEFIKSDICILPPVWKPNDRFKSNNKILTSWALGVPVAQNSEELERFLDPVERQKEADLRWQEIKEKWDVKQSVKEMKVLIEQLQAKKI